VEELAVGGGYDPVTRNIAKNDYVWQGKSLTFPLFLLTITVDTASYVYVL
jgi:hypothetical protein